MAPAKRDAAAAGAGAGAAGPPGKRARADDGGGGGMMGAEGAAMSAAMSAEEARAKAEALRRQVEMLKQQKLAKKAGKKLKKTKRKLEEQQPPDAKKPKTAPEAEKPEPKPAPPKASTRNPYLAHDDENEMEEGKLEGIDGETVEDVERQWERRRARKQKRAFKIVPQGKYIEAAKAQREQEARREYMQNRRDLDKRRHFRQLLDGQQAASGDANGAGSSSSAAASAVPQGLVERAPPPAMEWWDLDAVSKRRLAALLRRRQRAAQAGDAETMEVEKAGPENDIESKAGSQTNDGVDVGSNDDAEEDGGVTVADGRSRPESEDSDGEDDPAPDTQGDPSEPSKASASLRYEDLDPAAIRTLKLVQHPKYIDSIVPSRPAPPIPLYLTKEERKRRRRQARREKQQELHDRIAAGLIPPPPPKVKMSNMMRVLGEHAVLDPSKMEAEVRRQTQARVRDHEMRNQANKLTPQEKWDKKLRKVAEDSQGAPEVAVYRVSELSEPATLAASNRFKMDANAQKLLLTGCVVIVPEAIDVGGGETKKCNIVVVEGGTKRLYQFEKQMLRRIKWDPDGALGNTCVKVWQGVVPKKTWPRRFEFQEFATAAEAKEYLVSLGVAHYWETALRA